MSLFGSCYPSEVQEVVRQAKKTPKTRRAGLARFSLSCVSTAVETFPGQKLDAAAQRCSRRKA